MDLNHRNECVIVYMRKGKKKKDNILVVFNMTPVERENWKIKVHGKKEWQIIFNSDDEKYWGSGNFTTRKLQLPWWIKKANLYEINLHLPALSAIVLQ